MNLPQPYTASIKEIKALFGDELFIVQPKLDGIRAFWNGKKLLSRTGKELHLEHIAQELKDIYPLDGEIWHPDMNFGEILSTLKTDPQTLQFHIFDFLQDVPQLMRLDQLLEQKQFEYCYYVNFKRMTLGGLERIHREHLNRGYEGTIIRSTARSFVGGGIYKIKQHLDFEALLVSFDGLAGQFEPLPNPSGPSATAPFSCRIKGGMFPGDVATVICDSITEKGKPRFPRLK